MAHRVWLRPGAVAAGTAHTLPTDQPNILAVINAEIERARSAFTIADHGAHSHTENTAATYTQNATTAASSAESHTLASAAIYVAATPTKVTTRTFTLNAATEAGDLLILTYAAEGEQLST